MTLCYEVRNKSHIWLAAILDLANMVAPLGACFGALKNEFRMFWSTCMPDFMLVDKSAQSSPLEPGLRLICHRRPRQNRVGTYLILSDLSSERLTAR